MRPMRFITWAFLSVVLFAPLIAVMQFEACSELVTTALAATDNVCVDTGRNRACYGNSELAAEPQPGFGPFKFDEAGDTINVAQLNTLRLSPMDLDNGTWGVALLRLQADIPDSKPENVNLLLFGDVEVENLAPEPILMNITMNSSGNVNVRRDPESSAFVMGTLMKGQRVTARGRSEDNNWIYIDFPGEENARGWVQRTLVRSNENLNELQVVDPYFTRYGPMQAFYLRTGSKQSTCEEAPNDGLLVQTPEGIAEVRLWINEVKIRLGSTAFIQANPGNQMSIKTLEGAARVEALGVEQVALAGTGVTVQLDQNSGAAAPPSKPEAYTVTEVQNLPTENLDRPIDPVIQSEGHASAEVTEATAEAPTSAPIPATNTDVPTEQPSATKTNTDVPTAEPSATDVPPTDTDVPPTATDVPPTDVPPTDPPTAEASAEARSDDSSLSQGSGSSTPEPTGEGAGTQESDSSTPDSTPYL